jgi:hypothetical protein
MMIVLPKEAVDSNIRRGLCWSKVTQDLWCLDQWQHGRNEPEKNGEIGELGWEGKGKELIGESVSP